MGVEIVGLLLLAILRGEEGADKALFVGEGLAQGGYCFVFGGEHIFFGGEEGGEVGCRVTGGGLGDVAAGGDGLGDVSGGGRG